MSTKRSIFEEVGTAKPAPRMMPGAAEAAKARWRRAMTLWLGLLFLLVALMIGVGGMTRLTDSGLSITEWKPLTGAIPPLSDADWGVEFEKYKATPEFQQEKSSLTLQEFKTIYWWEWGHRQLGRFIGLVWGIGFLWFLISRKIPAGFTSRFLGLGLLGGLQGAVGWWMVASGLTGTMVDVASYRLAIHLGLAFLILGLIVWTILLLRAGDSELIRARRRATSGPKWMGAVLVGLGFAQVLLGALVAGIDAGRGYIDWPLMAGDILPPESFDLVPLWRNLFENPALVQFNHRVLGYVLLLSALVFWLATLRAPLSGLRRAFGAALVVLLLQALLGVVTVLYAAPLPLGLAHQAGAVIAFAVILRARFESRYPAEERLRA